jgi:hypothetical protein
MPVVSETYTKRLATNKSTLHHGPGMSPVGHRHWLLGNEGSAPWVLAAIHRILGI